MSVKLDHPFYVDIAYKNWKGVLQVASTIEFGARVPIYKNEFFELDMLTDIENRIGFEKVFIDIGGCMGNHSLFFAGPLKAKKVYTFEPSPYQVNLMKGTFLYNKINSVDIFPFAAGDEEGFGEIASIDFYHLGGTEIIYEPKGNIRIARIDEVLKNIEELHCIKIDAESSTGIAFSGCSNLIMKFKPVVYIEENNYEVVQSVIDKTAKELKYEKKEMYGIKGTNAIWRYEPK